MAELKPGMKAPEFTLPAGDGSSVSLGDFKGRKVVLYFYPKDNTPGCTREACAFEENLAAIKRKGAMVIGVSGDSPESHRKFASRYDLTFPLATDEKRDIMKKYGVWKEKKLYGKTFLGVIRTTFIVDEAGVVTHVFPKVKVEGHAEEILRNL